MVYIHYEGPRRVIRARQLRKNQTLAEQLLWTKVRNRQLGGYKIRRQEIIDEMIVDFYCTEKRLIIEIDGPYHKDPMQNAMDLNRDQELMDGGRAVLRFSNDQVITNIDFVLDTILSKLEDLPSQESNPLNHTSTSPLP